MRKIGMRWKSKKGRSALNLCIVSLAGNPELQSFMRLTVIKLYDCFDGRVMKINVNRSHEDTYGDTALHDAINCGAAGAGGARRDVQLVDAPHNVPTDTSHRIIQMLCNHPMMDFSISNKRGFNVLQHAALKGNAYACEAICLKAPHLVDVAKDDGFCALHLAALNGHRDAVITLVQVGSADLDLRNNRQQTPLLLAISQGHTSVIELLVSLNCNIAAVDEDGNTALHIVAMKRLNMQSEASRPTITDSPGIFKMYEKLTTEASLGNNRLPCAIALYLIWKGCDPEIKNKENKNFFDLFNCDVQVLQIIRNHIQSLRDMGSEASSPESSTSDIEHLENPMAEIRLGDRHPNTQTPNSTREMAFSGPEENVNQSPFKRNYNYNYHNDLGGDWSSNNSPIHKINAKDELPVRPSRTRSKGFQTPIEHSKLFIAITN
ncbi:E3 ubiquitin-protein ligase MIB2 [Eumeta japonica]|uniref:E3 ubiquitin-protein ligase MIB2 n=1 Tax=Eumeta variegata TaxID=151549 RepID=A0A4C1WX58_EUMVA|nr:E3 ubiquitin-protein ligase MIB2 [Eumeta japonica]